MNKNNLTQISSLLLGVCIMSLMIGYAVLAWTEPSLAPPGGNVPAPINIGSTSQTKSGNLTLQNLYLNAVGSEGNIYNTNIIQGYNDLIIYSNSSKNLPIYLEGSKVIINNDSGTGNVGIGTASPSSKLEINYPLNTTGLTLTSPGYDVDSLNAGLIFNSTINSEQQGRVVFYHRGTGDPGLDIWGYPSNSVPSCCVMIAHFGNNGNVGIGTASPSSKLEVAGQVKITGGSPGAGKVLTSDAAGLASWQAVAGGLGGSGTANYLAKFTAGTTIGNSLIYDNGTNVGIGTTGPAIKLAIGDTDTGLGWTGDGQLNLYSNNVNTISIRSGNVGIGTTSPTSKFQIGTNTVLQQWSGSTPYVLIQGIDNEVETIGFQIKDENQVELFRVSTLADGGATGGKAYFGGNVGIGTTSPVAKLEVAGQVKITGGSPGAGKVLTSDAAGLASWQAVAGGLGGGGTANYLAKFTAGTTIGNSLIYDNGTNVGIGTTGPAIKLAIGDTDTGLGWAGDGQLDLYSNNVNTISIRSGNVGIGTTGPAEDLHVFRGDSDVARIYATGSSQGSGMIYAGQSTSYGGGFSYDGDGIPNIIGGTDRITFFRRSAGIDYEVFSYAQNSNEVSLAGNLNVGGGTGKLTVGTIDPIFEIGGEKYATYVADFAGGVRMETSGTANLENRKYVIDFDKLEKGSDLWLFWQTSNKKIEDVVVLLTSSFEGKVWYEKNGNILTIYGKESGEVSYRLSAPRLDFKKWGNLTEDEGIEGIRVSDY